MLNSLESAEGILVTAAIRNITGQAVAKAFLQKPVDNDALLAVI